MSTASRAAMFLLRTRGTTRRSSPEHVFHARCAVALIGIAPNLLGDGFPAYGESADRWAFAMQYPVWLIGIAQVLRYRRRARFALAKRDPAAYDALRRGVALVPAG